MNLNDLKATLMNQYLLLLLNASLYLLLLLNATLMNQYLLLLLNATLMNQYLLLLLNATLMNQYSFATNEPYSYSLMLLMNQSP